MKRIAIIGSGITALAQAWELEQAGHVCSILETSERIGGSIQSIRQGKYLAEEGPNSIQVNTPELDAFFESIPGLEDRILEAEPAAKKRFIVRSGKLHAVPMNPIQAITTRLWSLRGRMRVLREPFLPAIDPDIEESAASFACRRLGEELYQYAINPLIGGIYAGDPEQLSLRYAFPKLYTLEQEHGGLIRGSLANMRAAKNNPAPGFKKRIISFKDGLVELPQHLARALGSKVRKGVRIDSILQEADGWKLISDGETQVFDELIITLPAHRLKRLPLPSRVSAQFQPLETIDYPPVSVLTLAYKRSDISHPLDGFGALVPECEKRSILGVLFPSSVFEGRAPEDEVLLTAFIGGERQPDLASEDTDALLKLVRTELGDLLRESGEPTFVHHKHWPRAIPQYKIGYGSILESIERIEAQFPGLRLQGNYRTGISLSYCIESALTVN